MSRRKKIFINILLLLVLWALLMLVFTLAKNQPVGIQIGLGAILVGLYGVAQTYLRNK